MITYQVTQPYVVADHSLLQILVYGANLPSLSPKVSGELYEQQDYDGLEIRPVTQFKSSNNHGNASCEVGENYEDDPEDDGIVSPNSDEKDDFDESRSADSESSPAVNAQSSFAAYRTGPHIKMSLMLVRGGALLHLYLRARDHAVYVSFVEPAAAAEFLQHAKTHGCHISGKRVRKPIEAVAHVLVLNHSSSS